MEEVTVNFNSSRKRKKMNKRTVLLRKVQSLFKIFKNYFSCEKDLKIKEKYYFNKRKI